MQDSRNLPYCILYEICRLVHVLRIIIQHPYEDFLHFSYCFYYFHDQIQETILHCKSNYPTFRQFYKKRTHFSAYDYKSLNRVTFLRNYFLTQILFI